MWVNKIIRYEGVEMFIYRGKRIRMFHQRLLLKYGFSMSLPFLALLGGYHFYFTYPRLENIQGDWDIYPFIVPFMVTLICLLVSLVATSLTIRFSILKGGFFARQYKKQQLAEYLNDNDFVIQKKVADGREIRKFPKVYYQNKRDVDEFTFRIGNKFHDKFLTIGKSLEELYMADLIEIERTVMHVTFKLLVDTISKRLTFEEVTIKGGVIQLMKGVEWDFDELPHMLITGGTGGGKTFFIYTLIAIIAKEGRVHIADPKKSDLSDLADFPAFKDLVFSESKDIVGMLKKAVDLMEKRFKYMKEHADHKMGKNYRYYKMPPEFFVVDEWGAFVSTLSMKEELELYQFISPLVLKARQAGVFLIIATQKAGTDVIKSMIRDNLMCKVSLGALSHTGYEITFGSENKNKAFYNKMKVKGRGYIDVGNGIPQEFYAPFITNKFSFEAYFKNMLPMPFLDLSNVILTQEERNKSEKEFLVKEATYIEENKQKKKESRQALYRQREEEYKEMMNMAGTNRSNEESL